MNNSLEASEIVTATCQLWKLSGAARWTCEEFRGWEVIAMERNGRRVFAVYDKETSYYGTFFQFDTAAHMVTRQAR